MSKWQVNTLGQSQSYRSHYDDAHLQTLSNVPTKCPPSTPYGIQEMAQTRVQPYGHCEKFKVKSRLHHDFAHLQSLSNVPTKCQLPTLYRFPRYCPGKILKVKVTKARSKVKSMSHHNVAHLQPLTNILTTYQLPTSYGF